MIDAAWQVPVLARAGLLGPARPSRLLRAGRELLRWDATLAGGSAVAATIAGASPAIIDERRTLTYTELHQRSNALARGMRQAGVGTGGSVGILCRNHGWFAEALLAASKLGANVLLLNTGLAAPQLRELLHRERPSIVVHDREFAEAVAIAGLPRLVAWCDQRDGSAETIEDLVAGGDGSDLPVPARHGRVILLTSGTTGAPKGARRPESAALGTPLAVLERIPLRAGRVTHIASPLFHSWGYMQLGLAIAVRAALVLRRRFDPEDVLACIERDRVDTLIAVPTMLSRVLDLPAAVRRRFDTSSLRVVAVSGSSLPAAVASRFMDEFGDVLYDLYGSTEVSWAAIATPAEMRRAPGTVGLPPRGTRVAIFDAAGQPVPIGAQGRIFAGNQTTFEGYTSGSGRELIDGLVSTGDIGHLDAAGRLFVDGREDEMIVSGGENIFPSEVEDALLGHPGVAEAAVIGVEDERFGQRLKAYVVPGAGAAVSADELRQLVRANLAPFKVPREIEFVTQLPRNAAGKVVKVDLAAKRGPAAS